MNNPAANAFPSPHSPQKVGRVTPCAPEVRSFIKRRAGTDAPYPARMSEAGLQTQGGLQGQPPMPVSGLHKFIYCPRRTWLPKIVRAQSASLDDALERADGDGSVAVHGHNDLPAIGVTPFLVAAFLADHRKAVLSQDTNNFPGVTDWEALAHGSATSRTFAPAGTASDAGSNHNSSASFALAMASSSVSPAEAHPGSSGKTADQRLVSGSCSTTNRSFMVEKITGRWPKDNTRADSPPPSPVLMVGRVTPCAPRRVSSRAARRGLTRPTHS